MDWKNMTTVKIGGVTKRDLDIPVSPTLHRVLSHLNSKGHKALIVGGAVRDALNGHKPKDIDVEVYGTDYDTLEKHLRPHGKTNLVGQAFGVIKFTGPDGDDYDFSLPRRDNKSGVGHRDFTVEHDSSIGPEEAASRRDFTINSLAYDPINRELHDYHGGERDLRNGVLRHTSEAFSEDPLRVLRGMQFAARFGMALHPDTAKLAHSIRGEYAHLPKERVAEEFMKLATKGKTPGAAIGYLKDSGWHENFPAIHDIIGTEQDPEWHPEGPVDVHTAHSMDAAARIADREGLHGDDRATLVLASLAHDFGKAVATQNDGGGITSYGHPEAGGPIAKKFLDDIGIKPDITQRVVPLVEQHMQHINFSHKGPTNRAIRRLAQRVSPSTVRELGWVAEADFSGRPPNEGGVPVGAQRMVEAADRSHVLDGPMEPLVKGRHILPYLTPGPQIGEVTRAAYQDQLDGKISTPEDAEAWVKKRFSSLALSNLAGTYDDSPGPASTQTKIASSPEIYNSERMAMAADPEFIKGWIDKHGPYLWHGVSGRGDDIDKMVENIKREGIKPNMRTKDPWPRPEEHGLPKGPWTREQDEELSRTHHDEYDEYYDAADEWWLHPRPNHVFMTTEPRSAYAEDGHIFRIDLRKLDPKNLKPDDDYLRDNAGDERLNVPELKNYYLPIDTPKDWDPKTLGEQANELGWGNNPQNTHDSFEADRGVVAHEGPIPPDAIEHFTVPKGTSWDSKKWDDLQKESHLPEDHEDYDEDENEPHSHMYHVSTLPNLHETGLDEESYLFDDLNEAREFGHSMHEKDDKYIYDVDTEHIGQYPDYNWAALEGEWNPSAHFTPDAIPAESVHLLEHAGPREGDKRPEWKTASWADVRNKGVRLKNSHSVNIIRLDDLIIAATVEGDHSTYNVVMNRQDPDSWAITFWECSCPWGDWAWKRQHQYVGRMCSHALATLYEAHKQEYTTASTHTAADSTKRRIQRWQTLQDTYGKEQGKTLKKFPDGWSIKHLKRGIDIGREGEMQSHCWDNALSDPEEYNYDPEPGDEYTQQMHVSLRDENGLPRVSFYHNPPKYPNGTGESWRFFGAHNATDWIDRHPDWGTKIENWMDSLPYPNSTDGGHGRGGGMFPTEDEPSRWHEPWKQAFYGPMPTKNTINPNHDFYTKALQYQTWRNNEHANAKPGDIIARMSNGPYGIKHNEHWPEPYKTVADSLQQGSCAICDDPFSARCKKHGDAAAAHKLMASGRWQPMCEDCMNRPDAAKAWQWSHKAYEESNYDNIKVPGIVVPRKVAALKEHDPHIIDDEASLRKHMMRKHIEGDDKDLRDAVNELGNDDLQQFHDEDHDFFHQNGWHGEGPKDFDDDDEGDYDYDYSPKWKNVKPKRVEDYVRGIEPSPKREGDNFDYDTRWFNDHTNTDVLDTIKSLHEAYPVTQKWFKGIHVSDHAPSPCVVSGAGQIWLPPHGLDKPNNVHPLEPRRGANSIIAHEFGHVLQAAIVADSVPETEHDKVGLHRSMDDLLSGNYEDDDLAHKDSPATYIMQHAKDKYPGEEVSGYAKTNQRECFAEMMRKHWLQPASGVDKQSRLVGHNIDFLYHKEGAGWKSRQDRTASLWYRKVMVDPEQVVASSRGGSLLVYGRNGRTQRLSVEIAEDAQSIRTGLMNRQFLPQDAGMVFLYPMPPSHSGFWMKNTLIPLSVAFWDRSGRIIEVLDMEPCNSGQNCPVYRCREPYWGAVEANKGWFARWGLGVGDRIELRQ